MGNAMTLVISLSALVLVVLALVGGTAIEHWEARRDAQHEQQGEERE